MHVVTTSDQLWSIAGEQVSFMYGPLPEDNRLSIFDDNSLERQQT